MELPVKFIDRMKKMLGFEVDAFLKSYDSEKAYGLRINPLKKVKKEFLPFTLTPVPWTEEGYYAKLSERPGKHILHEAGAYYIQEPSAMSVVSLLDPKPGDIVCDLCAAPGGKSTHAAGRLSNNGLLVSNEIFPQRAKILSQNVERFGLSNCVVCNESTDKMAEHFPDFFNKIIVDAPCSGEGMFRKDDTAIKEWSEDQVKVCAKRQMEILENADKMLKNGGVLVYSTCTFAPDENEEMIAWFLSKHPEYHVEPWSDILSFEGLSSGNTDFITGNYPDEILDQIPGTLRLWPHKLDGEGHFAARLRKEDTTDTSSESEDNSSISAEFNITSKKNKRGKSSSKKDVIPETFYEFINNFINKPDDITLPQNHPVSLIHNDNCMKLFGDELYAIPVGMNSLDSLKVMRAGLHLGTLKKGRFEPAHALAMSLNTDYVSQILDCDETAALSYLKGETLSCDSTLKSWTLVCYNSLPLGWGKATNGTLKNHYPKGLRIN